MYRRILVPIDGSEASLVGLKHAVALAKDQSARLRIVNVVDETVMTATMMEPSGAVFTGILDSLQAEGRKVLAKAAASAERAGVRSEAVQIPSGGRRVAAVILDEVRQWRADVIVMGTHGRRGLNRLLLGSDAEGVLREAPVPVLLTRQDIGGHVARRRTAKTPPVPAARPSA